MDILMRYTNVLLKGYSNDKTDEKTDRYEHILLSNIHLYLLIIPLLHAPGCFIKEVPNRYP